MITFSDYLQKKQFTNRSIREMNREINHLRNWAQGKEIELDALRHEQLIEYIAELQEKVKPQTIKNRLRAYSCYFEYLKQTEIITHNPVKGIQIKNEVKKKLKIIPQDKLDELYNNYKPKGRRAIFQKVLLGLIIYQATDQGTLERLQVKDINLDKAEIYLSGSRKSNARKLALKGSQLMPLYKYVSSLEKERDLFPFSMSNQLKFLLQGVRKENKTIKSIRQLRHSCIANWLKVYNQREVQYFCGYRYISSVEKYQTEEEEKLKNQLELNHPFLH